MYKIFMLIAIPALAIAWIAYALWMRKVYKEEAQKPKPVSERLQKRRSEVADWAQKMARFKPPKRDKQTQQNESEHDKND